MIQILADCKFEASSTFVCKRCLSRAQDVGNVGVDVGDGNVLEKVGKFCYLGDMLIGDGGADSAVLTRAKCAWNKFNELAPILTFKGASLKLKGRVCVRSCMIYGSETWPMRKEHDAVLERTR